MLQTPRSAANAVISKVLRFVGDPKREAAQRSIDGDATRLMRGEGAHSYLWANGDPSVTFGGAIPATAPQPQQFRTGPSGSEPIVDVNGGMISAAAASKVYDSPAMRIFADRMRRRG